MYSRLFFFIIVMSCGLLSAQAQQDSVKLFQKADELFTAMQMPDIYAKAINTSVEQQIKTTPALAGYKEDLRAFFDRCVGWSAVRTDVAKLYLKYYTPEDMDGLIKFYQTPAGKKMSMMASPLQQEVQVMQQDRLNAHLDEWNKFITEKTKEKN